jgi:glucose/arabinose dehydrogenase
MVGQSVRNPCEDTVAPIYEIPAHSAPLGLTFINSTQFPSDWQGDLLVSYHGSWNRLTPTGYKVVHMKVSGNSITSAEDFLTGFLPKNALIGPTSASGRPVDLIFDDKGNLYLSDDKAGNVYIIQRY